MKTVNADETVSCTCLKCWLRSCKLSRIVVTSPTKADWGESVFSSVQALRPLRHELLQIYVKHWHWISLNLLVLCVLMFSLVWATLSGALLP